MARAGLTVKDLQGPALDRLAIKDSRDLLLIDGFPPHPRASEAKALVADSLKSDAYRATFEREAAEWATPSMGRQPGLPARTASNESLDQASASTASPCSCEAKCQDSSISRASWHRLELDALGGGRRRKAPRNSSARRPLQTWSTARTAAVS